MPQYLYVISIILSSLALVISGITAWLSFFNKGKLQMTQPTIIFFGPDGGRFESSHNKIYLRSLFYCTAKKGCVLENLYVSIQRNESKQNFSVWAYGEKGNLKRGSGLFIPQEGVAFDHHFLLPKDGASFNFLAGSYKMTIFAKIVGNNNNIELMSISISISEQQAIQLKEANTGIYFDWGPDQQCYHSHIDSKPELEIDNEKLRKFIEDGFKS